MKGGARSLLEGTTVRSEEGLRTFFQIFFHMSQEIKKAKKTLSVPAIFLSNSSEVILRV